MNKIFLELNAYELFYANLCSDTIFYTNLTKIKLSLKFYAFLLFYAVPEACY